MFISYTDASVKDNKAFLAFVIFFEDRSTVKRKIVINDITDNNIAEGLAVIELLSFLNYYDLKNGTMLFDSDAVKLQLSKKRKDTYLPSNIKKKIQDFQIRIQVIPRKYNVAHSVCYKEKFFTSSNISDIDRSYYRKIPNYQEFSMQLSVMEDYRFIYNKGLVAFHEVLMKLNKEIWLADLVMQEDDVRIYAIHDKIIKVYRDTIVKVSKVNYVRIGNHWRVMNRRKKLKKIINNKNNF